jgi:hypothetical protein
MPKCPEEQPNGKVLTFSLTDLQLRTDDDAVLGRPSVSLELSLPFVTQLSNKR